MKKRMERFQINMRKDSYEKEELTEPSKSGILEDYLKKQQQR